MPRSNETSVLLATLALTVALLGGGGWWLARSGGLQRLWGDAPAPIANGADPVKPSTGDPPVMPDPGPEKLAAARAIADGETDRAIDILERLLQADRNDPEALIYLNNARIGNEPAYTILTVVPAGGSADAAAELLRGVAQAQDETNRAGGIGGVPLRVAIADDGNDPDAARTVAQAAAADPTILAAIGHFGSESTLAAGEIYQAEGLPVISPTSTSVTLSSLGDYAFRTVPSDRFTGAALADYLLETLQKQRAAVFFNAQSDYSRSLKDEFVTAVYAGGGDVTGETDLAGEGFEAAASTEQAIAAGAEVLVLLNNRDTLDPALAVVRANDRRLPLLGGDSPYSLDLLEVGAPAEGMVLAVPWHPRADPTAAFPQAALQLWGGEVNWRTAMSYDAARAAIAALEASAVAPEAPVADNRAAVRAALGNPNFAASGASGSIRFLPSGDRNRAAQLVQVQAGAGAGLDYEFVPLAPDR